VAAVLGAGVAVVAVTAALALAKREHHAGRETLPVLGTLPAFTLKSERGVPFGTADLRGKAWVANFIFTRCPTVCPLLTRKMASLQPRAQELGGALHLVSFSVDPEYDSPEVLRAYAAKQGADPLRWTFLTGGPEAIRATVVDGLKTSLGREGPPENFAGIFHGSHFVLIDGAGRIRGYYDSGDGASLEKLREEMTALARSESAR
jgi:protein SCO1